MDGVGFNKWVEVEIRGVKPGTSNLVIRLKVTLRQVYWMQTARCSPSTISVESVLFVLGFPVVEELSENTLILGEGAKNNATARQTK